MKSDGRPRSGLPALGSRPEYKAAAHGRSAAAGVKREWGEMGGSRRRRSF